MPAPQRQPGAGVIAHLLARPGRFAFVQAVRLLRGWLREQAAGAEEGAAAPLQFANSTALAFPPSAVESITLAPDGRAASLRPAFLGLLGVSGALPLHDTERLLAYEHAQGDLGPRAFYDLLAQRPIAQFYAACTRYRVRQRDPGDDDVLLPLLLAFAGVPGTAQQDKDDPPPQVLAYFAAQIGARVVSAAVLSGMLAEYFAVPVQIGQFCGAWDPLPPSLQTRLGGQHGVLGGGATAGARVWRCDLGIRLRLGPLDREGFDRFLPGAAGARALARVVGLCATGLVACDVQLLLAAPDVRAAALNGTARLGLDSFVLGQAATEARGDVCYRLALPHSG